MPKRNRVRHFEPRYGVSQAAVEVEAKVLSREVEDYLLFSMNDLKGHRTQHEADGRRDWQRLQLLTADLSEREPLIVHTLFFRDVYHLLQLYRSLVKLMVPSPAVPAVAPVRSVNPPPFDEWLFQPKGGAS